MENVPCWLKLLRLHKYTDLMMSMTYEEMINLTEDKLEVEGVTKGARTKILSNIQKLKDRPSILLDISRQLQMENCNMRKVLTDMEVLLKSPVKMELGYERKYWNKRRHDSGRDSGAEVSEDENDDMKYDSEGQMLVEMILNTLRQICSVLLLSQNTDSKNVSHFTSLLDICLAQECYKSQQKQLLQSWKYKLNSIWKGSSGVKKSKFKLKTRVNNEEKTFPISYWRSNETEPVIMSTQKRLSLQTDETKIIPSYHHRFSLPLYNASNQQQFFPESSLESTNLPDMRNKKCSSSVTSEDELDSRLECLCISVTETALN